MYLKKYNELIEYKINCDKIIKLINSKLEYLNLTYNSLINEINKDNLYLGIDSLNFQNKLIVSEFKFYENYFKNIINRIYGDYYKIFKNIKKFTENKLLLNDKIFDFPNYKEINDNIQYPFDKISDIRNGIFYYLNSLNDELSKKKNNLKKFSSLNNKGLILNYYINEESLNITIFNQNIILYSNYLEFSMDNHIKYLKTFSFKLNIFLENLNKDILIKNENETYTKNENENENENEIDTQMDTQINTQINTQNIILEKNENETLINVNNVSFSSDDNNGIKLEAKLTI